MSKNETTLLKGIAILFMLFLHLFNQINNATLCSDIYIGNLPFCHILTRMMNPVPFFIILSGYGLYASYSIGDKHRWQRIIKLGFHFWLVLFIFNSIGHFIKPATYPGKFLIFIENATAFNTTYNAEWWFLFPYILLSISSPYLFKLCNKYKAIIILGISYSLYLMSCYIISRYGEKYLYNNMAIYHPILYISLLFNFLLGAEACKNNWLSKKWMKPTLACILLITFCLIRCCITSGALHNLFCFGFIWLFLQTTRHHYLDKLLTYFGRQSMNMWLIHTFFCYYFFHDWIYSFKYPILIFLILTAISYYGSICIEFIYKTLNTFVNKLVVPKFQ